MATDFVRRNVWTLEAAGPWHPTLLAYASAITVMSQLPDADPRSLAYQAAVHGNVVADEFLDQCQHQGWYFLPWHRMYLYWFEDIVRTIVAGLDGVDDQTRAEWALPYWDYGGAAETRAIPPTFLAATLPDGTPNPLRVPRQLDVGDRLDGTDVDTGAALRSDRFAGIGGFGGARTGHNHFAEDPDARAGTLEMTPHNTVHSTVGGLLGQFETAGLDPLFWLHHANIDRLWEVWAVTMGHANPNEPAWLTGQTFRFRDGTGAERAQQPADVTTTLTQLHYEYEDISGPPATPGEDVPRSRRPTELIGATDESMALTGESASSAFDVAPPTRRSPGRVFLTVDDATASEMSAMTYRVYLTVPDDDPATTDEFLVGTASFFGADRSGAALRLAFDVTDVFTRLRADERWTDRVSVTFVPNWIAGGQSTGERLPQQPGEVRVGRVGIVVE
ncbi:tyrosinase family protein [Aldersonia sp. NBC_00410]|uniref:tyrosinase family protein n=1 Tax=Aldersonia sp. NBC_00410 TaxID=2975954 RepID=UPI002258CAC3|nr:tyrosinase family protein [Aldersonia sp. NBC_00410]MCX5043206.1 tyrosinase family protein [Aldersonia sp. NBC_00410]